MESGSWQPLERSVQACAAGPFMGLGTCLPPFPLCRLLVSGNCTVTGNERFGEEARVLSVCVFPPDSFSVRATLSSARAVGRVLPHVHPPLRASVFPPSRAWAK